MIEGSTTIIATGGAAKFEGISFTGAPGSTFKFSIEGDGIDEAKPNN